MRSRKREEYEWVDDAKNLDLVNEGSDAWESTDETMESWEAGFLAGASRAEEEPYQDDEDLWD